MTKFANVSIETQESPKPEGVVVGGYSVSLMLAGSPVQNQVVADVVAAVVFQIDAAGDYTVQALRIAESGEAISATVESAVFTIAPDMILVPVSVTVNLSDSMEVPVAVAVA
jgi:hypothetical protein